MIVLHILVLQIFAAVSCASAFFAGHFRSAVLYIFLFVTRGWQCHRRFGSWSSFCFPVHNWLAITLHPLGERLAEVLLVKRQLKVQSLFAECWRESGSTSVQSSLRQQQLRPEVEKIARF
jgi:hypothetical protein